MPPDALVHRVFIAATSAGLLRVHADRETGVLLGAERKLTVCDMLAMPFYRPVLEEGLRSALRDLSKELPPQGDSDLAQCGPIGHDALD